MYCTTNSMLRDGILLYILHITRIQTTGVSSLQAITGDCLGAAIHTGWFAKQVSRKLTHCRPINTYHVRRISTNFYVIRKVYKDKV